ncbi:MAG: shikimate dehydrogenase [Acidobacteria bacterium]|nr:shikimate dehydrogenase [Acidobacteriota bacterium]
METYRVKELNEQTEIYGIIGNPVAHSLSPYMHNAAFKFHNLNAVYIPFEVKNLNEFIAKFIKEETREIDLNFRGFSVTIPHKEAIIEHLDEIDEAAKAIGAVNTVKIENGKLYGFNTDAEGFIEPLRNSYSDLKDSRVAILGAGGAARACIYALKKENAKVTVFARNFEKAKRLAEEFKVQNSKFKIQSESFADFDILVNTTPLGTKGKFENETPALATQIDNVKLVYDLIYNPLETPFIKEAQRTNVRTIRGLAMLLRQGMEQFEIWTGKDAPMKEMSDAALRKLK